MDYMTNPELEEALRHVRLFFCWDSITRTWQLEKRVNGRAVWNSVMFHATNQGEAEGDALHYLDTYFLRPDRENILHPSSWVLIRKGIG